MNKLVRTLFKNLIDLGYKYITIVSNNFINFRINDTDYSVTIVREKYKEAESLKFECTPNYLIDYFCGHSSEFNNVDSIFRIIVNNRNFDVKLSRVEFAQYLDNIEIMINKWYEDKIIEAIKSLDNELDELD